MAILHDTAMNRSRGISRVVLGSTAIFAILAVVYLASIDIRATRGASITGDEPFYLLTTQSLLEDRNLDLTRQYELRSYETFFDHPDGLWTQSSARDNGELLSPHNPGLSVLMIPAFGIGGLKGAQIQMMVIAALTFSLAYILLVKITRTLLISWLATIAVGTSSTAFIYSTEIYPEFPAALILIISLLIVHGINRPDILRVLGLVIFLTSIVWLGVKYAPLAGLVAVWGLSRMDSSTRSVFLIAALLSAGFFVWFHITVFGGVTPYSVNLVYEGDATISILVDHLDFKQRLYRPLGLFVDERFGIARWAPILLLVIPAAPFLWTNGSLSRLVLALISVQMFIATFVAITMMGWWFPGRTLVTVLPLMGLPLAIVLIRSPIWARVTIGVLGAYTMAVTVALAMSGHSQEIVIAVDPFEMSSPIFQAISPIVPDYRVWNFNTWTLTALWLSLLGVLTLVMFRYTRATRFPNISDERD